MPLQPIAAVFGALGRGDPEAAVAHCDADVEFESRITSVEDAHYRGHEGVRSWFARLGEAFELVAVETRDLRSAGDRGVATNHFRARGRGSGVEIEQVFYLAFELQDGRLRRWRFFDSAVEARRAAGLDA